MARRIKIKLQDTTPPRVVFLDPEATQGAILGSTLFMADGSIGTPASVRAWLGVDAAPSNRDTPSSASGIRAHRLLQGLTLGDDHPQYTQWVQDEHITGAWVFENTLTVDIGNDTFQWQATNDMVQETVPFELVRTDDILSQTPWSFLNFVDESSANAPPVRVAHDDFGSIHIVTNANYAGLGGNLFVRDNTALPAFLYSLNQEFAAHAWHVAAAGSGTINWNAAGAAMLLGTKGQLQVVSAGSASVPAIAIGGNTGNGFWVSSNILRVSTLGVERLNIGATAVDSGVPFRAPIGSAGAPTFTFWVAGDDDTGMYRVAADQLGFSTGGVNRVTITTTEFVSAVGFRAPDGSASACGFGFTNDIDIGLFRVGTNILGVATAGSERLRISADGAWGLGGANFGTNGQVLTSHGSGAPPTWEDGGGGGGGSVESVLAGEGINVDDYVDPGNPVVSVDIFNLPEDSTPSAGNDFVMVYDEYANLLKKVSLADLPSAGGAPTSATYLTAEDETSTLANSRRLLAGTGITFDDTTPGERTVSASGGGGGAMTFVGSSVIAGAAATSISVSSLDLATHQHYVIYVILDNASGSTAVFSLYFNGDTTAGNYRRFTMAGGSASNASTAEMDGLLTGEAGIYEIHLWQDFDGKARALWTLSRASGSAMWRTGSVLWETGFANVTSLEIRSSVASAIAIGSRLRVFRVTE